VCERLPNGRCATAKRAEVGPATAQRATYYATKPHDEDYEFTIHEILTLSNEMTLRLRFKDNVHLAVAAPIVLGLI